MNKILLIYCDDASAARFGKQRKEFPPLGLLYLASACESKGIHVDVLNLSEIELSEIPYCEIIGLSINSSYNYERFYESIKWIREKCNVLLVGGQHASIFPKETISELEADYLLLGEGEYVLPDLITKYYKDKDIDIEGPGIISLKQKNTLDEKYSEKLRIDNLDELPFPARHLLKEDEILLDQRMYGEDIRSVSLITSRGCPLQCNFCGNLYKGFRHRSPENVEKEIVELIKAYPAMDGIVFLDENLLFSNEHMSELCDRISKYKLKWTCNARVDFFNKELINKMKDAGCVEIKYGIESGSQRMLDFMNKGITLSQISEALKGTYEAGIRTKCFLLFGYPGDNMESARETMQFISEHQNVISRVNVFDFSPLPNSPIFKKGVCKHFEHNWKDYRLYNQHTHWWGNEEDYCEMIQAYNLLKEYIDLRYGENGKSISS